MAHKLVDCLKLGHFDYLDLAAIPCGRHGLGLLDHDLLTVDLVELAIGETQVFSLSRPDGARGAHLTESTGVSENVKEADGRMEGNITSTGDSPYILTLRSPSRVK